MRLIFGYYKDGNLQYDPDKRPTQGIGIVPDVVVKPKIAGIRTGSNEVLDEALRQRGRQVPSADIEKMAKP